MDMHIYYNILYVQHNHIVGICNLDKQNPLKSNIKSLFCNFIKTHQRKSEHTEQNVGNLKIFGTNS
jgi:hypothetical protein